MNDYNMSVEELSERMKSIESFMTLNEKIEVGDFVIYKGIYQKEIGMHDTGIVRCTKIEKRSYSNYFYIYYIDINGEERNIAEKMCDKLYVEKVTRNNTHAGDFLLSLQNIGEDSRILHEVVQVITPTKIVGYNNDHIRYISNKKLYSRVSSFDSNEEFHNGFLKVFPIFKDENESNLNNDIFKNVSKNNSYINIIKNLVN